MAADVLSSVLWVVAAIVLAAMVYFVGAAFKDNHARRKAEREAAETRAQQQRPRKRKR